MGFDFSIEYKKGGDNVVADTLSRRHEAEPVVGSISAFSCLIPHWVDAVKEELQANSSLGELKQQIQQGEAIGPWKIVDGLILYKERIFLPTSHMILFKSFMEALMKVT